jgi:EAL domain-containing protein (putative c-di-GMP-specific phosphodiesterase class I)
MSVPPRLLSLELTESAALLDDRRAVRELHELREAGVNLSIDDYGTGYSSLMRVLDLPISTLKLDRSLTQRLPADRRALAVVKSTIDMANDLGIAVIAEGIELIEQRDSLLALGCRFGQGFMYGHAVPADQVTAALRTQAADDAGEFAATGTFSLCCAYPHDLVDPCSVAAEAIRSRHTTAVRADQPV